MGTYTHICISFGQLIIFPLKFVLTSQFVHWIALSLLSYLLST